MDGMIKMQDVPEQFIHVALNMFKVVLDRIVEIMIRKLKAMREISESFDEDFAVDIAMQMRNTLPGEDEVETHIVCLAGNCDINKCKECPANADFMQVFPRIIYQLSFVCNNKKHLFYFDVGTNTLMYPKDKTINRLDGDLLDYVMNKLGARIESEDEIDNINVVMRKAEELKNAPINLN